MKVAMVVGTRPQFVKAAVVIAAVQAHSSISQILIHTGQHYDDAMSAVFFQELGICQPEYNLGVESGPHGLQTARMLEGVEKILLQEKPDCALVYGDCNSTLAGALAAAKLHIPVAHVEAGLRSFDRRMAEEINRVIVDHVSDLLFAPTPAAMENLAREGLGGSKSQLVGDVMYDACLVYGEKAARESRVLEGLGVKPKRYILATIHRAENTDVPRRLRSILEALQRISSDQPVVFPVHPRTRRHLAQQGWDQGAANGALLITDPVGYLDMVMLEKNAEIIVTDSGGVQKEALFHQVPCVTVRDNTEWVETVELGWNRIALPESAEAVIQAVHAARDSRPKPPKGIYGDGHSAETIAALLLRHSERA